MKMSHLTFVLFLSLAALAVEGCAGYLEPPMLRDPRTGQVVNCDVPASRQTIGVTYQMESECVRGHIAAGMECVTESCLRKAR